MRGASAYDKDGNYVWTWRTLTSGDNHAALFSIGGAPFVQQFQSNVGLGSGWNAVANLDDDPFPEVIVVSQIFSSMWIFNHDGSIFSGPFKLFDNVFNTLQYTVGPPTVADFAGAWSRTLPSALAQVVIDRVPSTQRLARRLLARHAEEGETPGPMAIIALAAIREKMHYSDVPKPLRGLGITFIVAGLMAIGFMLFGGISL